MPEHAHQVRHSTSGEEYAPACIEAELPAPRRVTPFVASSWRSLSSGFPDVQVRNRVLEGLEYGFRMMFRGDFGMLRSATRNNPSAYRNGGVVTAYLGEKVRLGAVAGPFRSLPPHFHVSRFGVIPKGVDKFRLILDLSHPPEASVNEGISKSDSSVTFQSVADVIDMVLRGGRGTRMFKFDVARAYRNVPVHEGDRRLLGMRWEGLFYVDLALSFGGRSGAAIFTDVARVLAYILNTRLRASSVMQYLDDFIGVQVGGDAPFELDFEHTLELCKVLGGPSGAG
jgi:hypothetical protein